MRQWFNSQHNKKPSQKVFYLASLKSKDRHICFYINEITQYESQKQNKEKTGAEKITEDRECKGYTLVSPKLNVGVKSFYTKKVYINYMNCNFS